MSQIAQIQKKNYKHEYIDRKLRPKMRQPQGSSRSKSTSMKRIKTNLISIGWNIYSEPNGCTGANHTAMISSARAAAFMSSRMKMAQRIKKAWSIIHGAIPYRILLNQRKMIMTSENQSCSNCPRWRTMDHLSRTGNSGSKSSHLGRYQNCRTWSRIVSEGSLTWVMMICLGVL